jgi:hypothetical protein
MKKTKKKKEERGKEKEGHVDEAVMFVGSGCSRIHTYNWCFFFVFCGIL